MKRISNQNDWYTYRLTDLQFLAWLPVTWTFFQKIVLIFSKIFDFLKKSIANYVFLFKPCQMNKYQKTHERIPNQCNWYIHIDCRNFNFWRQTFNNDFRLQNIFKIRRFSISQNPWPFKHIISMNIVNEYRKNINTK